MPTAKNPDLLSAGAIAKELGRHRRSRLILI
jgi:hypothetical protein